MGERSSEESKVVRYAKDCCAPEREKEFMKITRPMYIGVPELIDLFTCWLTSSDGRHFGDSLEEFSFVKQKEMIDKYLPNMYNTAFVYNLKEHKGSLASTIDLSAKYKHRLIA